jgi:hypothetical protein
MLAGSAATIKSIAGSHRDFAADLDTVLRERMDDEDLEVANIADAATATLIAGFDGHATPNSAHADGARSRLRDLVSHSHSIPHAHWRHATTAGSATTSTMASHAD